jgi:Domain of unknown function (DUF6468)
MTLSLLFDGLLGVLLVTTIVYAAILNRKLKVLRQGEGEMKALLQQFNSQAAKAEANLGQMKAMAGQAHGGRATLDARESTIELAALRQEMGRALALKDDLTFLIDRGEMIADRLVKVVSEARSVARPGAAAPSAPEDGAAVNLSAVPVMPRPRNGGASSVAERELLKALRAARPER